MRDIIKTTIYVLADILTGEVRYVGKTAVHPDKRYRGHLYGKQATSKWCFAMAKTLLLPSL